jgi:hypothetical protein
MRNAKEFLLLPQSQAKTASSMNNDRADGNTEFGFQADFVN